MDTTLVILAFKKEAELEVWKKAGDLYVFTSVYPFTANSGTAGPKLEEGDLQIPEGIYTVDYLNPESRFYRSFKLNYPNAYDLEMARAEGRTNPGSDIFIHGGASSKGCIAIGDEAIEEVYTMVEMAGKDKVQVLIYPGRLREEPYTWLERKPLYDEMYSRLLRFKRV